MGDTRPRVFERTVKFGDSVQVSSGNHQIFCSMCLGVCERVEGVDVGIVV